MSTLELSLGAGPTLLAIDEASQHVSHEACKAVAHVRACKPVQYIITSLDDLAMQLGSANLQ